MTRANHKKIAEFIKPPLMMLIMQDSLSHKAIVKLCNLCSLSYDGTRTQSISTENLIIDLVDEFYEDEENAKTITKVLEKANSNTVRQVNRTPIDKLADRMMESPNHNIGRDLFALAVDDRPEANELIDNLAEALLKDELFKEIDESIEDNDLEGEDVLLDRREREKNFSKEIDKLRSQLGDLGRKNSDLEKMTAQFSQERRALKGKITDVQRELSACLKREAALKSEHANLKKKLDDSVTSEEKSDSLLPLNQVTKDIRKIQYSLERMNRNENVKSDVPNRFVEAVGQSISQIKKLLSENVAQGKTYKAEVKKYIDDIRSDLQVFQSETRKLIGAGVSGSARPKGDVDRIGVFVDVQNIFYAAKQFNSRLDFEKLLTTVSDNRRLIRAIAYVVQSPEVDQSGFITMLQQKNYQVKRKDLRLRSDGSAKGDWDMGMAIDVISLVDKLDVVVLVSGDGDFVSLVNLVKTIGPKVEIFSFQHNTARDLIQAADDYYPIEEGLLLRIDTGGVPTLNAPTAVSGTSRARSDSVSAEVESSESFDESQIGP